MKEGETNSTLNREVSDAFVAANEKSKRSSNDSTNMNENSNSTIAAQITNQENDSSLVNYNYIKSKWEKMDKDITTINEKLDKMRYT